PAQVDAVIVATQRGTLWGQEGIGGNTVPTAIGLAGVPCTRVENACPSGSDAFRIGAMAVASGVHDVVLVLGVEKLRDKSADEGLLSRAAAGHPVYTRGESAPVLFAAFATRHLHEKSTFVGLPAHQKAAERAYAMAGVGPADVDMAEVHDCFTITEILDIEDLGFCDKGKGGVMTLEGETSLTGRIPVNTSGGLLAKGHPIGATGVAQLTECWWQLRGDAGPRQVEMGNGLALQHNVGGRGSGVSVVNILTNRP